VTIITAYDLGRSSRDRQVEAWRAWIDFGYLTPEPLSDYDITSAAMGWARRHLGENAGEIKQTLPASKLFEARDGIR
jgi:hypothetical protein